MALTAKLIERSRTGSQSKDGYQFVREYSVTGTLTGTDADAAAEVLTASGLPSLGDAYNGTLTTVVCRQLQASVQQGQNRWHVRADYGDATDESDDPRLDTMGVPTFSSSSTQVRTSQDKDGDEMSIVYNGTMADVYPAEAVFALINPTVNYDARVEFDVDLPLLNFTITRRETSISTYLTRALAYQGRINSVIWDRTGATPAGVGVFPAFTVKCLGLELDTVNEGEFRARYRFEFDPDGFLGHGYPRIGGVIPSNAQRSDFHVLNEADFNALPCYI